MRAAASVVADTRQATISTIDIRRGTSAITGDVTADITNRAWSGKLHVESPNAEELQDADSRRVARARPTERRRHPRRHLRQLPLDTTINGRALTWAGQAIDRVTAKAIVTAEAIDVTSLQLFQGAGYLDGRVRYAWETGAYEANLKGDRLSWQGTLLSPNDTQAIFALQFDGAGTVAHPKGKASIDFALTGGDAGTLIGAGEATADLDRRPGAHRRAAARRSARSSMPTSPRRRRTTIA